MTEQDDLMIKKPVGTHAPNGSIEAESEPEIEVEIVLEEGKKRNSHPFGTLLLFLDEAAEEEAEPDIEVAIATEGRKGRHPIWLLLLLLLFGAVLFIGGTVGGTRAALSIRSDVYSAEVELLDIGITLTENGRAVSRRDYASSDGHYFWDEQIGSLLSDMLAETDNALKLGYRYSEAFGVTNSGRIDEYVRVIVYRYWMDVDENGRPIGKNLSLDPSLIELEWANLGNGWILDEASSTAERVILYYDRILPVGESTSVFTSTLMIDEQIPYLVTQSDDNSVITTHYDYGGMTFQVEIEADGVQTHNGRDAIQSAWGLSDTDLARLQSAGLRIEEG